MYIILQTSPSAVASRLHQLRERQARVEQLTKTLSQLQGEVTGNTGNPLVNCMYV